MTKTERDNQLDKIQKEVTRFADREILRLQVESEFLASVLKNSLGGLKKKNTAEAETAAIADAKQLLGL